MMPSLRFGIRTAPRIVLDLQQQSSTFVASSTAAHKLHYFELRPTRDVRGFPITLPHDACSVPPPLDPLESLADPEVLATVLPARHLKRFSVDNNMDGLNAGHGFRAATQSQTTCRRSKVFHLYRSYIDHYKLRIILADWYSDT